MGCPKSFEVGASAKASCDGLPAITALVSAYGLFFNASTITNNLSLLNDVVPGNVLDMVHEQASRIASNSGRDCMGCWFHFGKRLRTAFFLILGSCILVPKMN